MIIQFGEEFERYDPYMDMPTRGKHAKGGGSSSTTSIDAAYNARMATIAEAQQAQAEWYFDWMKTGDGGASYMDLENAKIGANMELLPAQTGLSMEQIGAARELLPGQTGLAGEQIGAARELLPGQTGLAGEQIGAARELLPGQTALSKEQTALGTEKAGFQREMMPAYFDSVREGADIGGRMNRASADVSQQFADVPGQVRREAGRMGMMPSSNRTLSRLADVDINRNKALATARTGARVQGEVTNLANLRESMSI